MSEQKNMIMAAVLSFLVIAVWFWLFPPAPPPEPMPETQATGQPVQPGVQPSGEIDTTAGPGASVDRAAALSQSARLPIETPKLSGSISLLGGRIDDLHLRNYKETLDPGAETVTLLSPVGSDTPYYAVYGWLPTTETPVKTPGPNTEWTLESGGELTPGAATVLAWDNGEGLVFRHSVSVDEDYMFTIGQSVENRTSAPVSLAPYGYVARRGEFETVGFYILHEGAVAVIDGTLKEIDYDDMADLDSTGRPGERQEIVSVTENGWLGFTDKYWMTTLAPAAGQPFDAVFKFTQRDTGPEYRSEMRLPVQTVAPGAVGAAETRLFAGAKEFKTINAYENEGVVKFIDSIDWGWFFFLTKPIFRFLDFIHGYIGNMGFSIIVLTLLIKALLFPLAYKSYVSMSKMKKLQPEMEKLKERFGDDRQAMQKEMMALYKREKANPAAGCLPILLQIPIFFSLYKVLFVTIEMRHAPFIGWIHDLSAPDPTSFINLFGLMPWDAPGAGSIFALFSIGVYPILMGVTMWMQQKLNPAPTDPTQAMIFAWMPWIFMFMLGQFAAGLVIYWCANNIITFIQQYAIMRTQGVDVDFFGNIKAGFKRRTAAASKAGHSAMKKSDPVVEDEAEDATGETPKPKAKPKAKSKPKAKPASKPKTVRKRKPKES